MPQRARGEGPNPVEELPTLGRMWALPGTPGLEHRAQQSACAAIESFGARGHLARDIERRTVLEEQLTYQAFHDPLTGLANRRRLGESTLSTTNTIVLLALGALLQLVLLASALHQQRAVRRDLLAQGSIHADRALLPAARYPRESRAQ